MPAQLTHPGVHVADSPGGARTIAGVPTSVTAFLGRAAKGPLNTPTPCFSFGDYVRCFGTPGHDGDGIPFMMSYSVEDFFLNGGVQAVILRLAQGPTDPLTIPAGNQPPAEARSATETATGLSLVAANPGRWGNRLLAKVDHTDVPSGATGAVFNLTVQLLDPTHPVTERFLNLSTAADAGKQRIDTVLATQSSLVRVKDGATIFGQTPTPSGAPLTAPSFSGGVDGGPLTPAMVMGDLATGLGALRTVETFNILCIPLEDVTSESDFVPAYQAAATCCVESRAVMVLDAPSVWVNSVNQQSFSEIDPARYFNFDEDQARNSAVYLPRILRVDEVDGMTKTFPASGAIAGQMAAVDASRGVWKAPAGTETALVGIVGFEANVSDGDNSQLNVMGVNCLRTFPIIGSVIWGARTLRGADTLEDDYKYLSVRRLTLFIEQSLIRGTKWALFEPNEASLWASLRTLITSFMAGLSRQGAVYDFQVICDHTTTTAADIDRGVVNFTVAFAPVQPAEFIVLQIQQAAGPAQG